MNSLTTNETKVLNNLSRVLKESVNLGDILNGVIDAVGIEGTPVNAVAATETLAITGVVINGETVTINNPALTGTDVYEFCSDEALTTASPTNIAVDITTYAAAAVGVLTMDAQPTSGDTVTIGAKTYIFVPVGTANGVGEVTIGVDLTAAQVALVAAINGTDGVNTAHPTVVATAFDEYDEMVVTALVGGSAGNAIPTTETFTAVTNIFAAVTLATGADCTAANAIIALVAAVTASDTQRVGAADGAGDTVVLTSDIAGVYGNDIIIAETIANAAFTAAATELSGGIDGTVALGVKVMVDETYLYICTEPNAISGANWRRIALGSVY